MSKTKLIALSGVCSAVATLSVLLCGVASWGMPAFTVIAAVAVVIPLLVDSKALTYSLLTYAVSFVLGAFATVGLGNVVYAVPALAFGIPFAIVKLFGDSGKIHPVLKWVIYYVLLEVAICLTLLVAYAFVKPLFEQLLANRYFYLLLVAAQLIVIPYDLVMRGCLVATNRVLNKIVK